MVRKRNLLDLVLREPVKIYAEKNKIEGGDTWLKKVTVVFLSPDVCLDLSYLRSWANLLDVPIMIADQKFLTSDNGEIKVLWKWEEAAREV